MTFDMGAMIAQAIAEHARETEEKMGRLLARPPVKKGEILGIELWVDEAMPPDEIHFRRYGVTVGKIGI